MPPKNLNLLTPASESPVVLFSFVQYLLPSSTSTLQKTVISTNLPFLSNLLPEQFVITYLPKLLVPCPVCSKLEYIEPSGNLVVFFIVTVL